jgi:hypothetical protein
MLPEVTRPLMGHTGFLMKGAILAAAVLVSTTGSLMAGTEELRPSEAKSLRLGEINGVAYYTVQSHGYRVVATLAGRSASPVRFEGNLLPGQTFVVSIPGGAGAQAQTVAFVRQGDRLLVETTPLQTE